MDPAEYYPMASSRRGICVVINNMTYWHPKFQVRHFPTLNLLRTLEYISRGINCASSDKDLPLALRTERYINFCELH